MTNATEHTIDAAGRSLGRVATEAAKALMGKTNASYTPNVDSKVTVKITNASKLRITEKKRTSQTYQRYSGYPGGLKEETLAHLAARSGFALIVRKAVERMLPRNTMRTPRLKRLIISE